MNDVKPTFQIKPFLALLLLALFSCFCIPSTAATLKDPLYLAIFCMALVAAWLLWGKRGLLGGDNESAAGEESKDPAAKWITPILLSGIFVKLCYILYTHVAQRQHDVVDFHVGEGQAAYIEYFVANRHLPNFDPRSIWGFFQPPLHHIVSGLWMRINMFLGLSERQAQENIQALTFFYMGALMILTDMVCRELKLQKRGRILAVLIVSLHPVFILLSGSINNDALSLVLMMLSLYLAIVWYKRPKIITIILLALSIGFSMFAKLTGGLIAPAVAALFLLKLIKEKQGRIRMLLQYAVFGVICLPIGLFWTVRNKLLYDMAPGYIPEVGQQFGHAPLLSRLFDFKMTSVFPAMLENGDAYYEHNVFLAMLKSSLFGEYNYGNSWRGFDVLCTILFIAALILAILAFAATILLIVKGRGGFATEWRWFFGILYATVLFAYLSFALSYDNYSAQDFRYAAILIVVEAVLLGFYSDTLDGSDRTSAVLLAIVKGAAAVFGVCSFATYLLLGFF